MPKATYLGHSAFYLEGKKGRIIIDPFISGNPTAKVKLQDIKADYVLLSHGHGDHIGDAVEIAKANRATIVAPFELANYCANKGASVHAMHIGGAHQFPFGRVKLTIAHHGSAAPDGTYVGNPCGFLVTMDEKIMYHTGDTGLFYDMKLIGEMNSIDLVVLPIGDNFTMGIDDAVKAVEFLKPKMAVPMHYRTFEVINVDPDEFVKKVKALGFNSQVMGIGSSFEF
jgi:L-ascorbate metabolism protein UlaG (beta-lactamase superfamily)